MAPLINANPVIYSQTPLRSGIVSESDLDDLVEDPLSALEVYELLCHINDPEHPHSLSALNVVQESLIQVDLVSQSITVRFTPTIPHCSMATLIGLCLRVRLLRSLPRRFKLEIRVTEGSHQSEAAVNKQLNDKERVAAALENAQLLDIVNQCLAPCLDR